MLLSQGATAIAEQIAALTIQGQLGTSTTFEQTTDTALISPLAASQENNTVTQSGNVIKIEYEVSPGTITDESVSEFAIQESDDTALTRRTFGAIIISSAISLQITNTWRITQ